VVRKKENGSRKRRTREHVIADLSVNHVERFVLRCGHTVERVRYDYGLDLAVITFDAAGALENGLIWLQLKATDRPRRTGDGRAIVVRIERRDVVHWLNERFPVVLVLYDAVQDTAYWLDVQTELSGGKIFQLRRRAATLTLHVPRANVVHEGCVQQFAKMKNEQLDRWAKGGLS
jgi:hypothetical protein